MITAIIRSFKNHLLVAEKNHEDGKRCYNSSSCYVFVTTCSTVNYTDKLYSIVTAQSSVTMLTAEVSLWADITL